MLAKGTRQKFARGSPGSKPVSYNQSHADDRFPGFSTRQIEHGEVLFAGFERCLQPVQKFQSDAERRLAVILDRESHKWFKPATGQFQITYRLGANHHDYQPDFVAELDDRIVMLEPKARNQMEDRRRARQAGRSASPGAPTPAPTPPPTTANPGATTLFPTTPSPRTGA